MIKIKKNICGLAKSKYICGGNYRAMAVNQYDRSYDNMFILYNNEEGRYILYSLRALIKQVMPAGKQRFFVWFASPVEMSMMNRIGIF